MSKLIVTNNRIIIDSSSFNKEIVDKLFKDLSYPENANHEYIPGKFNAIITYDGNQSYGGPLVWKLGDDIIASKDKLAELSKSDIDSKIDHKSILLNKIDMLLAKSDWTQLQDNISRMTKTEIDSWLKYRAKLRDIRKNTTDNFDKVKLPAPPK